MRRLTLLAGLLLVAAVPTLTSAQGAGPRAWVADAHVDAPLPYDPHPAGFDPFAEGQASADKLKAGDVGVIFAAVFVPRERTPQAYAAARAQADAKLAAWVDGVRRHPDRLALARSAGEARRIAASGRTAVVLSILNAYPFGEDAGALARYHAAGVQVVGLTHAGHNAFADSSRPHPGEPVAEHGGLSALGLAVLKEANRLGVLFDVSQLTKAGLLQATRATRAPLIASHSAVKGLVDTARNLDDEELDAVRRTGGVVAVTPFTAYLRPKPPGYDQRAEALAAQYKIKAPGVSPADRAAYAAALRAEFGQADLAQFVAAIDYVVKRIGVDHVGIGSDFNHGGGVAGLDDAAAYPNLATALRRRGYSEADLAKLMSGNVLRVLEAAERAAG